MLLKLKSELDQLAKSGLLRVFDPAHPVENGEIEIRGRRVLNFTSWDLLGINGERSFRRAIQGEIEEGGVSLPSPRLVSGTSLEHVLCESRIAQLFGTESSVLFGSRNQVILSLITALLSERDLLLYDELLLGPAADSAYLVNAQAISVNLDSPGQLDSELERGKHAMRKILFLEAISPITGEPRDLASILPIALKHGCLSIIDESFSTPFVGLRGAGVSESLLHELKPFAIIGSLGFGFASFGAFVTGSAVLISYLINRSRTFSAEPPLPPSIARAAREAIDLAELATAKRERLLARASRISTRLQALGHKVSGGSRSPIVSLEFGKNSIAQEFSEALFQRGFLVEVVPRGTLLSERSTIRVLPSILHSEKQIDHFLAATMELSQRIRD